MGRTKKMKLAFAVGTMVAGKRLKLSPRAVAELVSTQLEKNPQFKELGDQLRQDLRGVGTAASGALVERQLEGLAGRLHARTQGVQDRIAGVAPDVDDVRDAGERVTDLVPGRRRRGEYAEEEAADGDDMAYTDDEAYEDERDADEESRDAADESRGRSEDRERNEGGERAEKAPAGRRTGTARKTTGTAKKAPAKRSGSTAAEAAGTAKETVSGAKAAATRAPRAAKKTEAKGGRGRG
ncbi:DNA primase [Streptomyces sp. NPDC050264]|uniref:DNA primase n=1 Tax=Streptomyces sp. NPDC050264 TaxID=3155038 RepID=UPI00342EDC1C